MGTLIKLKTGVVITFKKNGNIDTLTSPFNDKTINKKIQNERSSN